MTLIAPAPAMAPARSDAAAPADDPPIAVVGAGWSGLAAAVRLAGAGRRVEVFDAAPQAGGRGRRVDIRLGGTDYALDNGQHLLIGAYRETLRLLETVGIAENAVLLRTPFAVRFADGWELRARDWPAPWHLIGAHARGLSWRDRFALARAAAGWQRAAWTLKADCSVAALLVDHPPALIERLWRPLCLAALNVEPAAASAQVFLTILRETLAAPASASHFLVPRVDLSAVFVAAACDWIERHDGLVRLRTPVLGLKAPPARRSTSTDDGTGWQLLLRDGSRAVRSIVLAVPPDRAAALLRTIGDTALDAGCAKLESIDFAPIATIYLRYPPATRLPHAFQALRDDAAAGRDGDLGDLGHVGHVGHVGQWAFDLGALAPNRDGIVSVVVSGAGRHTDVPQAQLAAAVVKQMGALFNLPAPIDHAVIVEKRATIVPAPGLLRPAPRLPLAGLFLAGDAAASPFPSTLEGSVRAGLAAASLVLA